MRTVAKIIKVYDEIEDRKWAVVFPNDPHGDYFDTYRLKKDAVADCKKYNLKVVK